MRECEGLILVYSITFPIATMLLNNGASVHERGASGSTTLQTSCNLKHADILRMLLGHGADPNVSGGKLGLPLEVASQASRSDIYDISAAYGADPSRNNPRRGTDIATTEVGATQAMMNIQTQATSPLLPSEKPQPSHAQYKWVSSAQCPSNSSQWTLC